MRNHVVLLYEDQEKGVATVGLIFFEMPPTGKLRYTGVAKLMNMYTIPSYRRRGISRKMMRQAVELARAKGCGKIMLNSSPMGQPLYESFGFSRIPNEYKLYPDDVQTNP